MSYVELNTDDDLAWLRDTVVSHMPAAIKYAVLCGNEDAPFAVFAWYNKAPEYDEPADVIWTAAGTRPRIDREQQVFDLFARINRDADRAAILKEYTVDSRGIIRDPGKFESELLFAPYFYDCASDGEELSGMVDGCGEYASLIPVDSDDRTKFPELGNSIYVLLTESDQGFVSVRCINTERGADEIREGYEQDEDEGEGADEDDEDKGKQDCPQCGGNDDSCLYCEGSGRVTYNHAAEWYRQNE